MPTAQPDTKLLYRQSDYSVQNMPPQQNDSSTNDPQMETTNKFLNLGYAWGQLELAVNSLSGAYETLSTFESHELPAKTIKKRMKDVRKVAKGIVDLVDAEKAAECEDMEIEGREARGESDAGKAEEQATETEKIA